LAFLTSFNRKKGASARNNQVINRVKSGTDHVF
jgi:hypothetical protein